MSPVHVLWIVLSLSVPAWSCCCLLRWLWRHRRVQLPMHRGRRRAGTGTAAGTHPRAKPEWVDAKVLYLLSHLDSCRAVAHAFNRWQGCWATVGKTWVWEFSREHDAEIRELRRQRKRRKALAVAVGHTWALDLTFIRPPFGASFTVLAILDAGSRKLLYLKVLPTKCALAILGHLMLAFSAAFDAHGLPAAIRTDNEAMFRSKLWLATLKALGIAALRGPPLQPWHNGRVERLFGTLKAALRGLRFTGAAALQRALDGFVRSYNELRPHQALDGLTPQEAWLGATMAQVQQAHAEGRGRWVQDAFEGLVGESQCHARC